MHKAGADSPGIDNESAMARLRGFEPPTHGSGGRCSIRAELQAREVSNLPFQKHSVFSAFVSEPEIHCGDYPPYAFSIPQERKGNEGFPAYKPRPNCPLLATQ